MILKCYLPVADLRRDMQPRGSKFFQFQAVFGKKLAESYVGFPPQELVPPPRGFAVAYLMNLFILCECIRCSDSVVLCLRGSQIFCKGTQLQYIHSLNYLIQQEVIQQIVCFVASLLPHRRHCDFNYSFLESSVKYHVWKRTKRCHKSKQF